MFSLLKSTLAYCAVLSLSIGLSGCASSTGSAGFWNAITPYKVEVVQGNVVTQEQAQLIKTGMGRQDVMNILGSPLLTDPFHKDRWDYVFTIKRQGADAQRHVVTVKFENEVVAQFDAKDLPSEVDFINSIAVSKKARAPKMALTDEELKKLPTPTVDKTAVSPPVGAVRTYPPLD